MKRAWLFLVAACGGASATAAQGVTICPAGSVLDPQSHACVAMEGVRPVVTEPVVSATASATASASAVASASASASPSASPSASVAVAMPPPATGFAVDVRCTFAQGWVSLVPAAKYPKDDQFLMQALIGFTKEPSFWTGLAEYRAIQPFAAKRCNGTSATRLLAPAAGDYYLVAGQENTFALRGSYANNGVKRKIAVNATTTVTLGPTDLVQTWVCISCPWIVFSAGDGRDLEPFVVLANRRGRALRGTDRRAVAHVPVTRGRITLRVVEVEDEITHLDALSLTAGGKPLAEGARSVLAKDDGAELRMGPHTEVSLSYVVPGISDGFVDVEVAATGYYDPL